MTSHLLVSAVDPAAPATLSRKVLSLLRERLGFDGLLVSDALDMAGASAGRGIPEAAVLALDAGADLLCLGADKEVDLMLAVQAAVVAAVRAGRLAEERLAEAAARVERLAARPRATAVGDLDAKLDTGAQLAGARDAIRVQGELPALHDAVSLLVDSSPNIAVGTVPWGVPADVVVDPSDRTP